MTTSSRSAEEIRGLGVLDGRSPWWRPNSLMVAFLLVVFIAGWNVVDLRSRALAQQDTTARLAASTARIATLAHENQRLAKIAAEGTYHNCVVTRALVVWANELGRLERLPHADLSYHVRRHTAFNQLHDTLYKVDGVPCQSLTGRARGPARIHHGKGK